MFAQRLPKYNSLLRLQKRLSRDRHRPGGQYARYYVAGTVGNGKTSELVQLATHLAQTRLVIYVDLFQHLEQIVRDPAAIDRLEPWELLGMVGLVIVRAGEDRFGQKWGADLKRFGAALDELRKPSEADPASLDLIELARGIAVAVGGVPGVALAVLKAAADATDWRWQIGLSDRKRRRSSDPEVKSLINAVNSLLMTLEREHMRSLVLIIDGIDRMRDEERMRSCLIDSPLLTRLACDLVVTGSEFMLHGVSQNSDDFRPVELCNVPVLDRNDPTRIGPGLGFFHEVVAQRIAAVTRQGHPERELLPENPFPDEVVERLAYYSGGVVRDFIRMAHLAAGEAWEANVPSMSVAMVDEVLAELRDAKQSRMTVGEIELLRRVMDDPNHGLPSEPMTLELLRQQRLLPYPNENPWYYPHPLLTLSMLNPAPGAAR